jgi:hypothetical protein
MRTSVCTRVSDQVLHFRLDAAPLANKFDAIAQTWTTARAATVQQAIAAGRVKFALDLRWHVRGGTGGVQINPGVFTTYIDRGVNALASVLCHELGHACGLVAPASLSKHAAGLHRFSSTSPPRAPINGHVQNARYYDATYGGSGTHCNLGAAQIASCITPSGRTYERQGTAQMCLMFHATTVDDNDVAYNNGVNFCDACIKQLRGR